MRLLAIASRGAAPRRPFAYSKPGACGVRFELHGRVRCAGPRSAAPQPRLRVGRSLLAEGVAVGLTAQHRSSRVS